MMKKSTHLQMLLAFFIFSQNCLCQVDVVYNDLVWADEFDGKGAISSTNWFHQTKLPAGGNWYNGEFQHYTNLERNSFVDEGSLNIVAIKENFTDQGVTKGYTSARLNSKFAFKYGRVDIRAKVPIELGTWPALWLLGKNINEDGGYFDSTHGTTSWPACGEIDIMEHGITRSYPKNYIQSALHTPSSYGNTKDIGGIIASSDIADNYHIYSMNWSPNEISFLLDNVIFYTYNPAVKDANTWPFDKEQYLLLNVAMGGVAGPIISNFTKTAMVIDYVRVYQNTAVDTQAPTAFTATSGAITGTSVELLLTATDNSGTVAYTIDYGAGTISTSFPSGIQKSVIIKGLLPKTSYNFAVSAKDASGNTYLNNPIIINATTTENTSTQCAGTSVEASENSFSAGYNYAFQTTGTDVKITFELLDKDKTGVVAFLRKQTPFEETQMTNVSGNTFTRTITGQTIGSTINYAVKFAYAGGLSVTKFFSYVVGSNCTLATLGPIELTQFYYPNPVENILELQLLDDSNHVILTNILGQKLFENTVKANHSVDMSTFKAGIYFLKVANSQGIRNFKILKK